MQLVQHFIMNPTSQMQDEGVVQVYQSSPMRSEGVLYLAIMRQQYTVTLNISVYDSLRMQEC